MKRLLLLILSVFLLAQSAWGAVSYYMRADGTAANKAAATACGAADTAMSISTHNSETFYAGDTIFVCSDGGDYRAKLLPPSSGNAVNPITYTSATGQSPLFNGSQVIANASFTLVSGKVNTYQADYTMGANLVAMVWENDTRLTSQGSIDLVEANPASFYYDSTGHIIYVHATSSSNVITNGRNYEVPQNYDIVQDNGKDYLIFDGLEVEKCYGSDATYGGFLLTGSHNILRNSSSHNNRRHCLQFGTGADNNTAYNMNLYDSVVSYAVSFFGAGCDSNLLQNSTVHDSTGGLIILHGATDGTIISTNNTVTGCDLYNATGKEGIEVYAATNTTISKNYIYGTYAARAIYVSDNDTNGINIYYNIIDISGVPTNTDAILVTNLDGVNIYNNVIYGDNNRPAIRALSAASNIKIKNNILYGVDEAFRIPVDCQTGIEIDYNNVTTNTQYGRWSETAYATLVLWSAASSQDTHSLSIAPRFRSTSDFRLLPSSPCINKGVSVGLTTDFIGHSLRGTPDIGAYEYWGTKGGGGFSNLNFNLGW